MRVDMHVHTVCSPCSVIRIDMLLARALEVGLDGICITDHDTSACQSILKNIVVPPGLSVIVGMEYTTPSGDFLVFGPVDSVPERLSAHDLLSWTRKQGGVTIPAHPFRKSRPVHPKVLEQCEIVEAINGRNLPHENSACRNWLSFHAGQKRGIAGSDAHTLSEIGQTFTHFSCDIYCPEDLIRGIHEGDYAACSMNDSPMARAI